MGIYRNDTRRIYPYCPMTPEQEEQTWRQEYPSQTEQSWIDTLDAARDEIDALRDENASLRSSLERVVELERCMSEDIKPLLVERECLQAEVEQLRLLERWVRRGNLSVHVDVRGWLESLDKLRAALAQRAESKA